jgi:hypothetical protein
LKRLDLVIKKEAFIAGGRLMYAAGEEDLLAY